MNLKSANLADDVIAWSKKQQLKDYVPGMIGAGVAAGAGALATGEREGENPRQRALRTLRNAAAAGLIGGAGTQRAVGGTVMATEPFRGDDSGPGFAKSLLGRVLGPTALNVTGQIRRDARAGKSLKAMFGGAGDINVDMAGKKLPIDFGAPMDYKDIDAKYKDISKQFRQVATTGPSEWGEFRDNLLSHPSFKGNAEEAGKFLNLNYGTRLRDRANRWLFPRSASLSNATARGFSRAGGVAGAAGLFAAPEVVDWAKRQAGVPSVSRYMAGPSFDLFGSDDKGGAQ